MPTGRIVRATLLALFAGIVVSGAAYGQQSDGMGRKCLSAAPEPWKWAALYVTSVFETNSTQGYSAIAGDADKQGMSVGFLQWNFNQGTIGEVLKHIENADELVAELMPMHGAAWLREARNSTNPSSRAAALKYIRDAQSGGGAAQLSTEVAAFLSHPAVREAQFKAAMERGSRAWRSAKDYAFDIKQTCRPHFAQYATFFDYDVQGGQRYIKDLTSFMESYREARGKTGVTASNPIAKGRGTISRYMALRSATWIMGAPHYLPCKVPARARDSHAWDSAANCELWRNSIQASAEDEDVWRAEFLYFALATAPLREVPEDFGNRKGSVAMGAGYSHGLYCDYTSLYADLDKYGSADDPIESWTPELIAQRVKAACKFAASGTP